MDIATAAFGLVSLAIELFEKAKTASTEKKAEILAAVQTAKAVLVDALAGMHEARAEESAATAAAIAAAKTPTP